MTFWPQTLAFAASLLTTSLFLAPARVAAEPAFSTEAASYAQRRLETVDKPVKIPPFPIRYADGRMGSLADYAGKVAVVTFWQARCPFCRIEMPHIDKLAREMGPEGLVVAPLTLDMEMASPQAALRDWGTPDLPLIQDMDRMNGGLLAMIYRGGPSIATPTSFIIDKTGHVRGMIWGGGEWASQGARDYLRALIAEPAS